VLTLLVPGVGMGGTEGVAPPIGESVSSGRWGVRRPVTIYCLIPAVLALLEYLSGR
jgi:hypothetical protein